MPHIKALLMARRALSASGHTRLRRQIKKHDTAADGWANQVEWCAIRAAPHVQEEDDWRA